MTRCVLNARKKLRPWSGAEREPDPGTERVGGLADLGGPDRGRGRVRVQQHAAHVGGCYAGGARRAGRPYRWLNALDSSCSG